MGEARELEFISLLVQTGPLPSLNVESQTGSLDMFADQL